MEVLKIAAFSDGATGGNPAGVVITDVLPEPAEMQRIAAEVGFSETAFAAPTGESWRVRYFSPESEVPFCGHATIALGAALALRVGNGVFPLILNQAKITVEGQVVSDAKNKSDATTPAITATLQSPPTHSETAPAELIKSALKLFGYSEKDLDKRIPPALIHGGANHLVLALSSRQALASMKYNLNEGRTLMTKAGLVTILLAYCETPRLFHTRNPFASGGVYEDPATGASTAAFAGYLRDIKWPHGGSIDIIQGEDMKMRSLLHADIQETPGSSIRISGTARIM
ncbi:MAG: PhzF family phenazine biosynthesis protein [Leptolyngbya sp.]|nr:PhzF family phenazine biosynthesis protein [Candidatus Melainabacteria bacterium]